MKKGQARKDSFFFRAWPPVFLVSREFDFQR
jgi:hypothetical protein